MKKKCLTTIIMLSLLFVFSTVSYAGDGMEEGTIETEFSKETELIPAMEELEFLPSQEEIEYLSVIMDDYEIGGGIIGEILYDRFHEPKFLMGISEKGYMILYRGTM